MKTTSIKLITIILLLLTGTTSLSAKAFALINTQQGQTIFFVDKDHALASNDNAGTEDLPWLTIQHGINQLVSGNTLQVKASVEPYFEPYRWSGSNWGGITINVSGTPANPIIIEGYPNERPVIDQQLAMSSLRAEDGTADDPDASKVLAGFFLFNANNIVIRNFEITQTSASGIMFAHDRHNNNITIENTYLHHIYGGDNTGGIRLDHADEATIKNNTIHDIYDIRNSNGNPYTPEIYGLHSGIHGYQPGNSIIENNLIYNVHRGVFQKAADSDGKDSNEVRRNVFYNIGYSAYALEVQGTGSSPALNAKFYENIVHDAERGVSSRLHEPSTQSDGMKIYNNTFYNVGEPTYLRGQAGIEFYNNIISGSDSVNFSVVKATGASVNEIDYLDNNLYHDSVNKWMLERFTSEFTWASLSNWQLAYSNDSGTGLSADPDTNSIEADPLFINPSNNNFRLESTSPANASNGIFSENLGAYGLGAEVIGAISNSLNTLIFCNGFE